MQSLCAAMAQTILNVSSVAVFTASPVKKDFTENIKAIWKLSLALHSFNLGIVVVCSAVCRGSLFPRCGNWGRFHPVGQGPLWHEWRIF